MTARDPRHAVGSVLIVDDSNVQRAKAVALCRELGTPLMIYEAASGAEALELLALLVLPPDLVIVDLEMPSMDGVELIQRLHERHSTMALIILSSRELALIQAVETLARNLGMPVLPSIQKPLLIETLRAALAGFASLARAGCVQGGEDAVPDLPAQALADAIAGGAIDVHYQP